MGWTIPHGGDNTGYLSSLGNAGAFPVGTPPLERGTPSEATVETSEVPPRETIRYLSLARGAGAGNP